MRRASRSLPSVTAARARSTSACAGCDPESEAMKPNRMKAKLAAGEAALGCSLMFPSPQLVEMLGHAGFDWVLLDCEHGSLAPADVEIMAIAADAVGITAI